MIIQHLDTLAEKKVVPAFPRSSGTHGAGKMGGGAEAIERALEGDMFLKALKGVWEDHTGSMHKITAVVRYMVRTLRSLHGGTDGLGQGIRSFGWCTSNI